MEYIIEQYPKFRDFNNSQLSEYQIEIRNKQKKYVYGNEKTCSKCFKKLPITEFYIANKVNGRRHNSCRDCKLRQAGVLEVGKQRFADKIFKKGFRRCSICKEIKHLSSYSKSKSGYGGYSNNCYACSHKLHSEFLQKQKEEIGDFYIRQYGLKRGIKVFDKEILERLRIEIIESRKPKYFLDGNEFLTGINLADYILKKYDIPITTTLKRLTDGCTESDCIIKERDFRRLKNKANKGNIKVTDTVTKEVYHFTNTKDEELLKMFGASTITEGIKTGRPVGRKSRISKYPNPCIIERIPNK